MAFLLRLALFALVCVVVGEVWFRTVIPACERPSTNGDNEQLVLHVDPMGTSQGLFTTGRLARRGGEWRVNRAGWISALEYAPADQRERPLIALLGDSYIEGFLTDVEEHVDPYLKQALGGQCEVYAFGMSGWHLEQYLAVSRYVTENYEPDLLVLVVGRGDVSASVVERGVVDHNYWQIVPTATGGFEEVPPVLLKKSMRVLVARKSAILRYLRYNVKVQVGGAAAGAPVIEAPPAAGGVPGAKGVTAYSEAWRDLMPATEYLVDRLCAENPGTPIVFAFRGVRYLPSQDLESTPLFDDALAIQAACEDLPQCHVFDLRPVFSADWEANHKRFESADGSHWNAYANQLVADALARFIRENGLVAPASTP